ncbi:MAG: SsrA-binding protein SmpB [SAR324 cluster bacterium]|uniref:SsrA-binding protein n=1 Tax=SAR324 cluster bacterium TaxID=2024889 RepID=A0A7X9FSE4_9DELT|nr:SsrA-binding protein SmpB [SAR324 cluster bacterium]
MAKAKQLPESSGKKIIVVNKKARFRYHVIETYEAGIVLLGSEIKSVRLGHVSIDESYVRPQGNEIFLINAHIKEYPFSKHEKIDPLRPRKLLLSRPEIEKLRGRVEMKGLTIIPISIYLKKGRAKLEIALAKGKDTPDKRLTIKEREINREMKRYVKR